MFEPDQINGPVYRVTLGGIDITEMVSGFEVRESLRAPARTASIRTARLPSTAELEAGGFRVADQIQSFLLAPAEALGRFTPIARLRELLAERYPDVAEAAEALQRILTVVQILPTDPATGLELAASLLGYTDQVDQYLVLLGRAAVQSGQSLETLAAGLFQLPGGSTEALRAVLSGLGLPSETLPSVGDALQDLRQMVNAPGGLLGAAEGMLNHPWTLLLLPGVALSIEQGYRGGELVQIFSGELTKPATSYRGTHLAADGWLWLGEHVVTGQWQEVSAEELLQIWGHLVGYEAANLAVPEGIISRFNATDEPLSTLIQRLTDLLARQLGTDVSEFTWGLDRTGSMFYGPRRPGQTHQIDPSMVQSLRLPKSDHEPGSLVTVPLPQVQRGDTLSVVDQRIGAVQQVLVEGIEFSSGFQKHHIQRVRMNP